MNTVGKMIVAYGYFVNVEVSCGENKKGGAAREETRCRFSKEEVYLKKFQSNGAVYLALNTDHHAEFRAWSTTESR